MVLGCTQLVANAILDIVEEPEATQTGADVEAARSVGREIVCKNLGLHHLGNEGLRYQVRLLLFSHREMLRNEIQLAIMQRSDWVEMPCLTLTEMP